MFSSQRPALRNFPHTAPYASSFAPRAGAVAGSAIPGMYPLPAGGTAGGTPAMAPLPLSNFQKSVNLERANNAQSAATFASMAPLPKAPDGQYDGAYGKGAAGEQAASAAKSAYIQRQQNVSNAQDFGQGENYFFDQERALSAEGRENAESQAHVGYVGSVAGQNNAGADAIRAHTQQIVPLTADQLRQQTESGRDANRRANDMVPLTQAQLAEQARGTQLQNDATAAGLPYVAKEKQQQLDRGAEELNQARQNAPLTREQLAAQTNKTNAEATAIARPPAALPPDPNAEADVLIKRRKAAREAAEKRYYEQTGLVGTPLARGAFVRADGQGANKSIDQLMEEELQKLTPQSPGDSRGGDATMIPGMGAAASATAIPPEGTRGTHKSGRPVVVRNGQWVFAN